MDEALTYRLPSVDDIPAVSGLVARVFDRYVAPEYAPEGVREFHRYIRPSAFRRRSRTDHFILIVLVQKEVVGMIEMRGHNHISLLFVAPDFQRRGIARELLRQALQVCRAEEPSLLEISVNSSSYALPVYEKLGFCRTGERQVRNGIGFIPMTLKLQS